MLQTLQFPVLLFQLIYPVSACYQSSQQGQESSKELKSGQISTQEGRNGKNLASRASCESLLALDPGGVWCESFCALVVSDTSCSTTALPALACLHSESGDVNELA